MVKTKKEKVAFKGLVCGSKDYKRDDYVGADSPLRVIEILDDARDDIIDFVNENKSMKFKLTLEVDNGDDKEKKDDPDSMLNWLIKHRGKKTLEEVLEDYYGSGSGTGLGAGLHD